ncbi:MAG: HDOD domain-containing protein [Gemmatimonadaceae bacterium]
MTSDFSHGQSESILGLPDVDERLATRLLAIQRGEDFPILSRAIVDTLSAIPDNEASVQRLTNVVMREYTLTLKVIRAANSAMYRRSDRPVQTATHAMLLLGAGAVRKIAGSLLLFEHYHRRSPGLRELMLLSLLSANHAREIAVRLGDVDPEEAHLCAMFRNLGEVLVAAHFATDYARIRDLVLEWRKTEHDAMWMVLGCSYEELGEAIARLWALPDSIAACMRPATTGSTTRLAAVVALSHDLTNAVYGRKKNEDADAVSRVMARHAHHVSLPPDAMGEVLEAALSETREVFGSSGVRLDDLRLRRQRDEALVALGVSTPPFASPAIRAQGSPPPAALRDDLRRAVAASADPASGDDVHRLLMVTLEAAYRGCPLDRAIMSVLTPDRKELNARLGFGAGVDALVERFRFRLTPLDGPVAVAALRKRAVCVPMEREFTAQEAVWAESLGASSFIVIPLQVQSRVVGCVYGDRATDAPFPSQSDIAFLKELCAMAEQGMTQRSGRLGSRGVG